MSWVGGSVGGTVAAAAEKQRQNEEEEIDLTRYSDDDLRDDWEFKIVRSMWPIFNNRERLEQVIAEEAEASWQFVELFDAQRVRFKRPGTAHKYDDQLPEGVNPYRTQVGGAQTLAFTLLIVGIVLAVVLGIVVMVLFSV